MRRFRVTAEDKDPNDSEPEGTRTAYAGEHRPGEPYALVAGSNVTVQLWVREDALRRWFGVGGPVLCHEGKLSVLGRVPSGSKYFAQVCKLAGKSADVVVGLM